MDEQRFKQRWHRKQLCPKCWLYAGLAVVSLTNMALGKAHQVRAAATGDPETGQLIQPDQLSPEEQAAITFLQKDPCPNCEAREQGVGTTEAVSEATETAAVTETAETTETTEDQAPLTGEQVLALMPVGTEWEETDEDYRYTLPLTADLEAVEQLVADLVTAKPVVVEAPVSVVLPEMGEEVVLAETPDSPGQIVNTDDGLKSETLQIEEFVVPKTVLMANDDVSAEARQLFDDVIAAFEQAIQPGYILNEFPAKDGTFGLDDIIQGLPITLRELQTKTQNALEYAEQHLDSPTVLSILGTLKENLEVIPDIEKPTHPIIIYRTVQNLGNEIDKIVEEEGSQGGEVNERYEEAKVAAQDALNQDASPVSNEPTVIAARETLQQLLDADDEENAAELVDATAAYESAVADAKAAREAIQAEGNALIDDLLAQGISSQAIVNNRSGQLVSLSDKANDELATTAEVQAAVDDLRAVAAAVQQAQDALDMVTNPVSNEAEVGSSKQALEAILSNVNATAEEVVTAASTFTGAVTAAKNARTTAVNAANQTIANLPENPGAAIVQAKSHLETVLNQAGLEQATTAQVQAATAALTAMVGALENLEAGLNQDSTPVSNEASVIAAKATLAAVLDDATATPESIAAAIQTYTKAINDAKDARDAAKTAAQQAIGASAIVTRPAVTQAQQSLETLMGQADSETATTDEIIASIQSLNNLVTAMQAGKNMLDQPNSTPVGNESDVIAARAALESAMNNEAATPASLASAVANYQAAIDEANGERATAKDDAQRALADAEGLNNPAVTKASDALNAVLTQALAENATTGEIAAATNDLKAIVAAAQSAQATLDQGGSPVGNESEVAEKRAVLEAKMADESATPADLTEAEAVYTQAIAAAKVVREDVVAKANQVLADIQGTDRPAVKQAKLALEEALRKGEAEQATTFDIEEATAALEAIDAAVVAGQAALNNGNGAVRNERAVAAARTKLENLLADENATPEALQEATAEYKQADSAATTAREAAEADAQQAINGAAEMTNPAVVQAVTALNTLLADAENGQATTDDVKAATKKLEDLTKAVEDSQTVLAAIDSRPVGNEVEVIEAQAELNRVLNDAAATPDDINKATADYDQAVTDAKTARNAAKAEAADAMANSSAVNRPAVDKLKAELKDVLDQADDEQATTAEIEAATENLNEIGTAITATENALAEIDSGAVKNEAEVIAAEAAIEAALNQADVTPTDLADKVEAYRDAIKDANTDREAAVDAATTAITDAETVTNPAVNRARTDLEAILDNAANGEATTEDVKVATKTLEDLTKAVKDTEAELAAIDSDPVGNEAGVIDAKDALNEAMADKDVTPGELADAVGNYKQAIEDANTARDEAVDKATDAITDSESVDNPAVDKAKDELNSILDAAADGNATTEQVEEATTKLNDIVTAVKETEAALEGIDSGAVRNEVDVITTGDTLEEVLSDPNATPDELANAVDAYKQAIEDAKEVRNAVVDKATDAIAESKTVDNPAVDKAKDELNLILEDAANGNATTEQVEEATQKLEDITNAVKDIQTELGQIDSAPVGNESGVIGAEDALEEVLNNPDATPEDLANAVDNYNQAIEDAKGARDEAVDKATDTITESLTVTNPAVDKAKGELETILEAAANGTATTEQVEEATQQLEDITKAVKDTQTELGEIDSDPVGNESGVIDAERALDDMLNNPNATPDDLANAVDNYKQAIKDAKEARDAAVDKATDAITDSESVDNSAVDKAKGELNSILDEAANGTATTEQVEEATQKLEDITNAVKNTQAELGEIDSAPVGNESGVTAAEDVLEEVLNNPDATSEDLANALDNYKQAIEDAKEARKEAVDKATDAITNSESVDNSAVDKAKGELNSILDEAANGTATTEQVEEATQKLEDITNTVKETQTELGQVDSAPVGNESGVIDAKNTLDEVLDNPDATPDDLTSAMNDYKQAIEDAKEARAEAVDKATTAVAESETVDNPAVNKAKDELNAILDEAANGTATTEQIKEATQKLEDITTAVKDTQTELGEIDSDPVGNESGVIDAERALDDMLNNPNATPDDLADAVDNYNQVIEEAKEARNAAVDKATDAITDSESVDNSAVNKAKDELNSILDEAANGTATTEQIQEATQKLDDITTAVKDTQTELEQIDSSPVGNESGVIDAKDALDEVLTDPDATPDDLSNAVDNYKQAIEDAKEARDTAVGDATDTVIKSETLDNPAVNKAKDELDAILDKAANGTATTEQVEEATQKLEDLINAVKDTQTELGQIDSAPVGNESGVIDAKNTLDEVLNNPDATPDDLSDAVEDYKQAIEDAKTARNEVVEKANDAINDSETVDNSAVDKAKNELASILDEAANGTATTEQIQEATQKLDNITTAVKDTQTELGQIDSTPVSNEPGVMNAKTTLDEVLTDPNATPDDLFNAIDNYKQAITTATEARTAAEGDAATAIADSRTTDAPTVVQARAALEALLTAAAEEQATTAELVEAIQQLDAAVAAITDTRVAAEASLNQPSAPVTNEPPVAAARDTLAALLADPQSSGMALQEAADIYSQAIEAAKTVRDQTLADGTAAVQAASEAGVTGYARVQAAIAAYEALVTQAAQDQALTADLQDAIAEIQAATAAAIQARNEEAAKQAEAERLAEKGQAAIDEAQGAGVDRNEDVQAAIDAYEKLVDQNASNADLEAAIDVIVSETAATVNLKQQANQLLQQTAPVSLEPQVQVAVAELKQQLPDASRATIQQAMNQLTEAVQAAITERSQALAAGEALLAAIGDEFSTAPELQAAIGLYRELVKLAAADRATTQALLDAQAQLGVILDQLQAGGGQSLPGLPTEGVEQGPGNSQQPPSQQPQTSGTATSGQPGTSGGGLIGNATGDAAGQAPLADPGALPPAVAAAHLPQTGDARNVPVTLIGAALLALLTLVAVARRREEEEE